jgi:alpha-tubulin suppressor-like RCC1 family protein
VALDAGSVAQNTIIVISQNPTPYHDACSGPLATKLCQYPQFYTFDEFPHARLLKAGKFSVCHDNGGTSRLPLADHDRFRLAHAKPSDPADYTPGSTIRDQNGESIEILPLIHQAFATCTDVQYTASAGTGVRGALQRFARAVGRLVVPSEAYAIDQGGGGLSLDFSPFNDVDPLSAPDRVVQSVTPSLGSVHPGDHITVGYSVKNIGTATGASVSATIRFSASSTPTVSDPVLASVIIPALPPGSSATQANVAVTIPITATIGNQYVGLLVNDDATFPDASLLNNTLASAETVNPGFAGMPRRMFVGETHLCALNALNTLYCWGDNSSWQYGAAAPQSSSPIVAAVQGGGFAELSGGGVSSSTCGISASRSAMCWGRGGFGQLGGGIVGSFTTPPVTVAGGISWASISNARLSTCGVSTTGVGYCWGSNQRGEVGVASVPTGITAASSTLSPLQLDGGLTFTSVVAGWVHACGITTTGRVYCWGDNNRGQLGIGSIDTTAVRSPTPIAGNLQFIQLSLGALHTCGITVDHVAYCWGENYTGQLGDGTTTSRGSPTVVAGGLHFAYIAAGSGFAVGGAAVAPAGSPQAGVAHTCALTETGVPYCWGWNDDGQLGDGTTTSQLTPVPVAGSLQLTVIRLGGATTCGMRGNAIWCWGGNAFGELGVGTLIDSSLPLLVSPPFSTP